MFSANWYLKNSARVCIRARSNAKEDTKTDIVIVLIWPVGATFLRWHAILLLPLRCEAVLKRYRPDSANFVGSWRQRFDQLHAGDQIYHSYTEYNLSGRVPSSDNRELTEYDDLVLRQERLELRHEMEISVISHRQADLFECFPPLQCWRLIKSTSIATHRQRELELTAVKSGDTSVGSTFPPGNA